MNTDININRDNDMLLEKIKQAYDDKTRAGDVEMDFLRSHVYRYISFRMTVPFVRAGWSADQTTGARIIIGFIGLGLLMMGNYWAQVAGALLLFLNVILDYVDGNIARVSGSTFFGGFLDDIADILIKAFTPLCVAVGLYFRPDIYLVGSNIDPIAILLVGAVIFACSCAKAYVQAEHARYKLLAEAKARELDQDQPPEACDTKSPPLSIVYIYRTGVSAVHILLPICAITDTLSLFLALMVVARVASFPIVLVQSVYDAHRNLHWD
ncbi:MAG: CDP-alcohol phosphatidyltransferase family protein [Gammaproteobacteria bacterium]